jgi:hypothetical protein
MVFLPDCCCLIDLVVTCFGLLTSLPVSTMQYLYLQYAQNKPKHTKCE